MSRTAAEVPRASSLTAALTRAAVLATLVVLLVLATGVGAWAQPFDEVPPPTPPTEPTTPVPPLPPEQPAGVTVTLEGGVEGLSGTVTTILLLTALAVAPVALMLMTTFTRFVVVLGLARQGLGLQTVPPAQVLVGLAVFLSLFSMAPTFSQVNEVALQPLLEGELDAFEAAEEAYGPLRTFMLSQTDERDLRMFLELQGAEDPATPDDINATTLIPAFVISELRTAFTIGFVVFVPFLIVDLVVAAVLMSLGMVMLPPIFVSLPLKLLLFVLVDGWALLSRSLVGSVLG